jgi:hypothetical protein
MDFEREEKIRDYVRLRASHKREVIFILKIAISNICAKRFYLNEQKP